tara:strand:- start:23557 stop:24087 length:531 start_codon:yes stop_codon:yes gene_type:complete
MKSWKFKVLAPIVLISVLVLAKFILFDFPISSGKRVGNLVKISKKGKIIKTWEGTIDEGSGDKLTHYFSVKDNAVAQELYDYEGKLVILYYEEYLVGWPEDTTYNVVAWAPKEGSIESNSTDENVKEKVSQSILSKTLFCTMLGTIYKDQELYKAVKKHLEENNLYLFKQIDKCND